MRIISGKFKGHPIIAPKGQTTRPTSDRAREALFNMIAHAEWAPILEGARVIDLFAGSGSLGLEAVSRGAEFALFVETDSRARGSVRQNIEALNLFASTQIYRRSATALGPRPTHFNVPFNIAFLDPPYHKDLVAPALAQLLDGNWLTDEALIMVESGADESLEFIGLDTINERIKGAAKVTFLRRN